VEHIPHTPFGQIRPLGGLLVQGLQFPLLVAELADHVLERTHQDRDLVGVRFRRGPQPGGRVPDFTDQRFVGADGAAQQVPTQRQQRQDGDRLEEDRELLERPHERRLRILDEQKHQEGRFQTIGIQHRPGQNRRDLTIVRNGECFQQHLIRGRARGLQLIERQLVGDLRRDADRGLAEVRDALGIPDLQQVQTFPLVDPLQPDQALLAGQRGVHDQLQLGDHPAHLRRPERVVALGLNLVHVESEEHVHRHRRHDGQRDDSA